MATVLAGFLSPWPLGWIAATPSGRIYLFFFPPEKSLERVVAAGVCSPEVGGGGGGIWVVMVG
jgi:hypothetical protein